MFTSGGQDLVLSNGAYHTKIESFERIQAFNNQEYWVVTQKDGTRLEYGRTADARRELPGKGTYAWHLSRVVDASDKAVEYAYEGDPSARRVSVVRYTLRGSVTSLTVSRDREASRPASDSKLSPAEAGAASMPAAARSVGKMSMTLTGVSTRPRGRASDQTRAEDPKEAALLSPLAHSFFLTLETKAQHPPGASTLLS